VNISFKNYFSFLLHELALAIYLISASVFGAYGSPSSLSGSSYYPPVVILLILFLIKTEPFFASSLIFFLSMKETMQQITTKTIMTMPVEPNPAAAASLVTDLPPILNASYYLHYCHEPS
jgi:hypothetical protein